ALRSARQGAAGTGHTADRADDGHRSVTGNLAHSTLRYDGSSRRFVRCLRDRQHGVARAVQSLWGRCVVSNPGTHPCGYSTDSWTSAQGASFMKSSVTHTLKPLALLLGLCIAQVQAASLDGIRDG